MYRFNSYLESTHQPIKIIRHTKKVNDKFSLAKLQSVFWQYFIEQIIRQIDRLKKDQIYDDKSCHTFQKFLQSLDFDEVKALNLDIQVNRGGLLPIENYTDATELLQVFDLFYYMNGKFPFTTGLLPIPDGDFPTFVGDQKILIKKLYEQFRGSLSHGIVAVPFICALNLFLSGDPEK